VNINTATISGGLTRDPEAFSHGAKLSIGVTERKKNGDNYENVSHYFEVVVFGTIGEWAVRDLRKGSKVAVQGRLDYRSWEKDGQKRSAVQIIAERIDYPKPQTGSGSSGQAMSGEQAVLAAVSDTFGLGPSDDIPFRATIDGIN